jgi:exodeoxyribonuclease VII large subunit
MPNEIRIQTVSEVTRRIKQILEGSFPSVTVQGEISNFKRHTSGHLYFTLKDESAQISCVMWRSRAAGLAFTPDDGMKVIVTGRVTVYEVRGNYQIDASSIRPLGVGELQIAFERLKQKLAAEGLFDQDRKKPLPQYPERIGIVTSPTGAALQDMLKIFRRRYPCLTVILDPVRVQGAGAAEEIARAIGEFNEFGDVELIIAGRGGGSLEDLWAFNEEVVARAIASSAIPVVSAVGHEVDFTIADFVADLRAPTPSAAAEMVVPDRLTLLDILRNNSYTMHEKIAHTLEGHRKNILHLLKSYALNRPVDLFRQFSQRLDELTKSMNLSSAHAAEMARVHAASLFQRLNSLDPDRVLRRGYTIVSRDGRIIGSRALVRPHDELDIRFHDGTVKSTAS